MTCSTIGLKPWELTHRVTLQSRSVTQDALGQEAASWADVVTVWAQAQPLRGREFFAAGQTQSEVTTRFLIRWRSDVVPTMRVIWRGEPYDIDAAIDVDGARQVLELMCRAGVRDGHE